MNNTHNIGGLEFAVKYVRVPSYAGSDTGYVQHTRRNNYRFCKSPREYLSQRDSLRNFYIFAEPDYPINSDVQEYAIDCDEGIVSLTVSELFVNMFCSQRDYQKRYLPSSSGRMITLRGTENDVEQAWNALGLKGNYHRLGR